MWERLSVGRKVLLYGDPDVDGLISLKFMVDFCNMLGVGHAYYVNPGREHGFRLNTDVLDGYLILSADFGVLPSEMRAVCAGNNIAWLATDHHSVEEDDIGYGDDGYLWTNQYSYVSEDQRYLSGAGVFYELVCEGWPEFRSEEREALVGVTLLSDLRDLKTSGARRYLDTLYRFDIEKSDYIGKLVYGVMGDAIDRGFGVVRLDRTFVDFTFSSMVNATLRAGRLADAVRFILMGEPLDSAVKDIQTEIMGDFAKSRISEYSNVVVSFIDDTAISLKYGISVTTYLGLYCNQLRTKYKGKSVLGVCLSGSRASFRGRYDGKDYRSIFLSMQVDAGGHSAAFGLKDFDYKGFDYLLLNEKLKVYDVEAPKHDVRDVRSLAGVTGSRGRELAVENMYRGDSDRIYLNYVGSCVVETRRTYKLTRYQDSDGECETVHKDGVLYRYVLDDSGQKITKYIEYLVDGVKVKSFSVELKEGWLVPTLERGYLVYFVRAKIV